MSATFRVDDVEPARELLPTRRHAEVVGDVLAFGGDADRPIIEHGPAHPLAAAVHRAFAEHRPLVLSPDAVWLTIAQGVAHHVRLNAESLRPRLVRQAATKTLTVVWDGPTPADAASWADVVAKMRDRVAHEIGDGPVRLLECDFSTTTDVERVASRVVLMDVYSPYFDYVVVAICGIPEITLLGSVDDWRNIRARIDVIAELGLAWWTRSLVPIADQLVRAAAGDPDIPFWQRIYSPRDAYGGDRITGWISRLFPYLNHDGSVGLPNPMLELAIDEPRGHDPAWGQFGGPGIRLGDIPAGPSTARVLVDDVLRGRRYPVALDGGVLAVAQDPAGRLVPVCGWVLRNAPPSIEAVTDRIRAEHQANPCRPLTDAERVLLQGPADYVGLYSQMDGAVLFAAGASWRIRRFAEQELIDVAGHAGDLPMARLIDLPDGTFIALAHTSPPVYVRGRADALGPPPGDFTDASIFPGLRGSSQPVAEFPVVAFSLAELLDAALDSGGSLDLPSHGSLDAR